ncbi:MAG: DUF4276 family protein [Calditrichaeota bacterium]|nr:DUF4276 family protein [Calditrichota bacterium]
MVKAKIFIEGGGDKSLDLICQKGFHMLLRKCGFTGRMPRLVPWGARGFVYRRFKSEHAEKAPSDYVAMLIDSEDPMNDIKKAWEHLRTRDNWAKPSGATDDQVLFMTTCMETWIVTDRAALKSHYLKLNTRKLPPLNNLENRDRHDVQDRLKEATKDCTNNYEKGKRSYETLEKLDPAILGDHLPSFKRMTRILDEKL